jgi:D-3-phosphoglycerate dehydrogenase
MKLTVLTTTSSFSAEGFGKTLNVVHNPYGRRLTEREAIELNKNYNPVGIVAGMEPITGQVMKAAKNLRVISRCGIGMDSVDLDAADKLGITVVNTPDAPTEAVAELTVGMILSVLRNISYLDKITREGTWKGPKGLLLQGKTVGLIGCGRIGSRVARLLKAFDCILVGYDPAVSSHSHINMIGLDEVIEISDIVTLHIPLTTKTKNILSGDRIKKMKKGGVIINTARGGLIDEKTLYEVLVNGHLYGAGLDCYTKEPYAGNLTRLDNVVLTPHMGSSTIETRKIMEKRAVENLMDELRKQKII